MKKAILLFFAVVVLTGITAEAWSQKSRYISDNGYTTGVGIRMGSETGLSYKYFYRPTWAFEGTITTGYRAVVLTALFEKHLPIFEVDGMNLLFGGGVHVGRWRRVAYYTPQFDDENVYYVKRFDNTPSAGVDGIVGVEYKIPDIPFSIGADIKPFVDVFHPYESWAEGAITVRYVFR
jgi:hypothetical protein